MNGARPPTVTGPRRERVLGSALDVLGVVARRDRVLRAHLALPVVDPSTDLWERQVSRLLLLGLVPVARQGRLARPSRGEHDNSEPGEDD